MRLMLSVWTAGDLPPTDGDLWPYEAVHNGGKKEE